MKLSMFADRGSLLNTPELRGAYQKGLQAPGLTEVMILLRWEDLEPEEGTFNFTRLQAYLDLTPQTLRVGYGIVPGVFAPQWLKSQCRGITATVARVRGGTPAPEFICDPTDPKYGIALMTAHTAVNGYLADQSSHFIGNVRATPCSLSDDEACLVSHNADGTSLQSAWEAINFTYPAFMAFWQDHCKSLAELWPNVLISCPIMDVDTEFPTIPPDQPIDIMDQIIGSCAKAGYPFGVMQNTFSTDTPNGDWLEWVSRGALPYAQMNDWGGTQGALPEKGAAPSVEGFHNILENAEDLGVLGIEIHQVDCENEAYWPTIQGFSD